MNLRIPSVITAAALVIGLAVVPGAGAGEAPPEPCGLTTLDATLELQSDGTIGCGPGQPLVVREELAPAGAARSETRTPLTSFLAIADVQLADEESPARGEGADPCFPSPGVSSSAFRPHETMVPHLMNAHISAANAIAATGGPNTDDEIDFLVGLGDLADNQQYNEIRWIIDILDGGKLVDPDTGNDPVLGGEGYDGPQADDPTGAGGRTTSDVGDLPDRVLELANEPFWATGFRLGNDHAAERLPWYSLPGNHDLKVQGTLPDELTGHNHDDMKAWRAVYRSYYIGHVKAAFQDLPPDYKQELCQALGQQDPDRAAALLSRLASNMENAATSTARKVIPSDDERMPLYRSQEMKQPGDEELCVAAAAGRTRAQEICTSSWIDEHRVTEGFPVGHGYGAADDESSPRCRDADGNLLERACYSFTSEDDLLRYIALDTNPPEGAEQGNIDPAQLEWLERELIANSTTYFDESGSLVEDPDGQDRLIVIMGHHTTTSMSNEFAPFSPGAEGPELIELLLRFPNVILNVNGHTHQNEIWARGADDDRAETGYWEVNTSAIADFPTQSRVIEIADNRDATLSIFATVFDALSAPNSADIDWDGDDPTDEIALSGGSATQSINEDWLASWGREVQYHDPQTDLTKLGDPDDRNVELLLRAPEWFANQADVETVLTYTGETSGRVGSNVRVAALLTTGDGEPLEGMTVAFTRGRDSTTAVTDAAGVASSSLKITGRPGNSPLEVIFAGTDAHPPAQVSVPFEATSGPKR